MASPKEIRGKIKSVKNTQKITRAMEKVAMSKMRRANERMSAAKPYSEAILRLIGRLSQARPEYIHPFMIDRELKTVAFLIVSSDRGLAGGLNMNVFRTALRELRQYSDRGVETRLALIGGKGQAFFRRIGGKPLAQIAQLGDKPQLDQLLGIIQVVVDAFRNGEIDRLYIVSNESVNTMTQRPLLRQLLPLPKADAPVSKVPWDYLYEPDVESLLDTVLTRFIESQVYQAVIENAASEQSARMVAMKAASDNASKIIGGLQLAYNKARQASITKELAEIVGGAAAV